MGRSRRKAEREGEGICKKSNNPTLKGGEHSSKQANKQTKQLTQHIFHKLY